MGSVDDCKSKEQTIIHFRWDFFLEEQIGPKSVPTAKEVTLYKTCNSSHWREEGEEKQWSGHVTFIFISWSCYLFETVVAHL